MAKSALFRRTLTDELRDPAFAQEYDRELQRLRIAEQITRARQAAGLTQAALAQRMRTSQPAVARLEHGDYRGYTLAVLARAASALGRRLKVELVASSGPMVVWKSAKKSLPLRAAKKKT